MDRSGSFASPLWGAISTEVRTPPAPFVMSQVIVATRLTSRWPSLRLPDGVPISW